MMSDTTDGTTEPPNARPEPTAVDDVRRVRERIARAHGGRTAEQVRESNRIAEQLRERLNVRIVAPPPAEPRSGTGG